MRSTRKSSAERPRADIGAPSVSQEPDEWRCAKRDAFDCPVELETGSGRLQDISTGGLYFITGLRHRVGEAISLVICFKHSAWMRCVGEVLRVSSDQDRYGVAALFKDFDLA